MGGHQGHVPPQNSGLYTVKISKFCKISFFIIVVPPRCPPNIRGSLAPLHMNVVTICNSIWSLFGIDLFSFDRHFFVSWTLNSTELARYVVYFSIFLAPLCHVCMCVQKDFTFFNSFSFQKTSNQICTLFSWRYFSQLIVSEVFYGVTTYIHTNPTNNLCT